MASAEERGDEEEQEGETENTWQLKYKDITKHCSQYRTERVRGVFFFQLNGFSAVCSKTTPVALNVVICAKLQCCNVIPVAEPCPGSLLQRKT